MTILQNAGEVLRLFGTGCTDLTVSVVATRLSMPKANASRLMKAMRDAGILETIGNTRRHRPGRLVLDLATAFKHSSSLIGRASEVVGEVSRRFGHTGYLSMLEGCEVTGVADFPGTNTLRVMGAVGRRLKAEDSATGRSLLARLPEEEVRRLYAGHSGLEGLLEKLTAIRKQGFSYSSQEATAGVDAIAIAVSDPTTDEAVSLCIVYPHAVVDRKDCEEMLGALAAGCTRIALELGDATFVEPVIPQKGAFE